MGSQSDPILVDLERALRALPSPMIPEGLQDRLIGSIPSTKARAIDHVPFRMAVASVVAASIPLALLAGSRAEPDRALARATPSALKSTSIDSILRPALIVNTWETRPCSILPPLPY